MSDTAKIREMNDQLRTTFCGGRVVMTDSIASLPDEERIDIMRAVVAFSDFSKDNDPYGEHDFGSFTCLGQRCMFKIDYYDKELKFHSPDPSDPAVTTRVLTVMLASDY